MSNQNKAKKCPKCGFESGDDWAQCSGKCPMPMSPHYENKAKTRDELIDKAADAFYATDPSDVDAFTAGAKWADANPPPEVQGLIEALQILTMNDENKERLERVDSETLRIILLHCTSVASAALETYRKVTNEKQRNECNHSSIFNGVCGKCLMPVSKE